MSGSKFNPNYFTYPKPIVGICVVLLLLLFYLSMSQPESFLLDYFGPLGTFGKYMNKNHYGVLQIILYVSTLIHAGEATYAVILCRRKKLNVLPTVLWMVQTFIMGFPSLLQLVAYKPHKKLF